MKTKQIRLRQIYYHLKHNFFTVNNAVIVIAAVVALSWAWGSVAMMQRNYTLQRRLDSKERELLLTQLEVQTLEFQRQYHQSTEYQELAARELLGLAQPGEKVLYLPPNTDAAKQIDQAAQRPAERLEVSNYQQWMNFLSGRNVRDLPEDE